MPKKFEDMTPSEKQEAFDKWVANRTARRGVSKLKRDAVAKLIKAHQGEYDALMGKGKKAEA